MRLSDIFLVMTGCILAIASGEDRGDSLQISNRYVARDLGPPRAEARVPVTGDTDV
jgi:hypothetical protein